MSDIGFIILVIICSYFIGRGVADTVPTWWSKDAQIGILLIALLAFSAILVKAII